MVSYIKATIQDLGDNRQLADDLVQWLRARGLYVNTWERSSMATGRFEPED